MAREAEIFFAYYKLADENARLRDGLERLKVMDYDAGYSPEDYAAAVLSGDEPQKMSG